MKEQWSALDVCKFLFALLLICAHYASERGGFPPLLDLGFSLYILAVPFFFACSGFLFFRKYRIEDGASQKKRLKKYCIRIAKMYLAWSAIYFVFVLGDWAVNGVTQQQIIGYLHKCLVFSTYSTIWFLPALIVGVVITCVLSSRLRVGQLVVVALVFYALGCLDKSYSFIAVNNEFLSGVYSAYDRLFFTARNGVFNAFPFVTLGYLLAARYDDFLQEGPRRSLLLFFVFLCLLIGECLVLKLVFHNSDENTTLMLIPCTWFLMKFLLLVRIPQRKIFVSMRKMSTLLFVSQRLYLSAIPSICAGYAYVITINPYLGLFIVLLSTLATSWVISHCAKYSKMISWLC